MNSANFIPSLQAETLAREMERQFKDEASAVTAAAQRDAQAIVAQARTAARRRLHEFVRELRREGAHRLARAQAQLETEQRARAQRQAAQATADALAMLRPELDARWHDRHHRKQWTDAVARLSGQRLRPSAWLIEHPPEWNEAEQQDFAAAIGSGVTVSFTADRDLKSGLRIKADQALLDATPDGLLADSGVIAALLLDQIEQESSR